MKKLLNGIACAIKASRVLKIILIVSIVAGTVKIMGVVGEYQEAARVAALTPEERQREEQVKLDKLAAERAQEAEKAAVERVKDAYYSALVDLKSSLKDPGSFEVIKGISMPLKDGGTRIYFKYRAKNSFGGYVIEETWYDYKTLKYRPFVRGSF